MTTMMTPRTFLREELAPTTEVQVQRRLRGLRQSDVLALVGSLASALATTALVVTMVAPLQGAIGAALITYALFLAYYALLVSFDETAEVVRDRLAMVFVCSVAITLFVVLVGILGYTLVRGGNAIWHGNFFTQDLRHAGPLQGLDVGGIVHAIVGSLEQITIALLITIPLGMATAVFLNEFPGAFARFVRTITEAMTALPSIVAGLFIYATLIIGIKIPLTGVQIQIPKSGLAAALAISVMMLPIMIRAADVVIRLVPASLREASYALGTSRWATVWHIVLPTARSGLTTAIILATARGIGETSPVLLTAGYTTNFNADPTKGPQVSLPLATFTLVKAPQKAMIERGFGAAAVLLALVLTLFVIARAIGGRAPGEISAGQRRRAVRRSATDARRFAARGAILLMVLGGVGALVFHPTGPAYADGYVPISGEGSTWSQVAIDDWRRNVTQYGITVNYDGQGSSAGRAAFANNAVDFGVSEIPYGTTDQGIVENAPARPFAYMPIVAGGTSFMYHLTIGGHQVTNLRLSGDTVTGIFTGTIGQWNDPAIANDNPGLALPAEPIVPVVRSDGSGTTAQFTTWMSKTHAGPWNAYCQKAGRSSPCGVTSSYPVVAGSRTVAQSGSLGVAGFVSAPQNEGTITYVEYAYPMQDGYPVAKMLNSAGYYVEPTANNVAVGLLGAGINQDLTQNLDGVYANPDPRTYPLSSYSYMIIPTSTSGSFTPAKGNTLGAFAYYFLCQGQQEAPALGYSPLPKNLVEAGLAQVRKIPGVNVQSIDISKCNNPTFSPDGTNLLAKNAPMPPECDKIGVTQCSTGTGGAANKSTTTKGGSTAAAAGGKAGAAGTTAAGAAVAAAPGAVDPLTGLPAGASAADGGGSVTANAISLTSSSTDSLRTILTILAALILVAVVILPPLAARLLAQRIGPK